MVSGKVPRVIVIGGGAAGFFGAIACAENTKDDVDIRIFEKSSKFLSKVKIVISMHEVEQTNAKNSI